MVTIDDFGRPEPKPAAGEVETLLGFLDFQRATLKWKCKRVDAAGLSTKIASSSMTLGGLLKHMAFVENDWFARWLPDNERLEPWRSIDWSAQPDWEWETAANDSPAALMGQWLEAVDLSRLITHTALTNGGLDQLAKRKWPNGDAPSLRWIIVHMIEEYARHNGLCQGEIDVLIQQLSGRNYSTLQCRLDLNERIIARYRWKPQHLDHLN